MVKKLLAPLAAVLLIALCAAAPAADWVAFSNPGNPAISGYPDQFTFSFENNVLTLNAPEIVTVGGSSSMTYSLMLSGMWAFCGTVDSSGIYTADPYATFVSGSNGGHVEWNAATPAGYATTLHVGTPFVGDGAAAYAGSWWGTELQPVTGTLVVEQRQTMNSSNVSYAAAGTHTFEVVAVPEPSGLIALMAGAVSLFGVIGRTRRNRGI